MHKLLQVPPDLKPAFRAQLLAQDFVAGRAVNAGVLEVCPAAAASEHQYCLKLMLDTLGRVPGESDALLAAIDRSTSPP
jgi:hypothetical protein